VQIILIVAAVWLVGCVALFKPVWWLLGYGAGFAARGFNRSAPPAYQRHPSKMVDVMPLVPPPAADSPPVASTVSGRRATWGWDDQPASTS
jgi:hypothetical protein